LASPLNCVGHILLVDPQRSKFLPEGGNVPEEEMAILATRLRAVLEYARSKGGAIIRRDEAARNLWGVVYERLSEGLPGLLGAATSRAEAQVLRLSALYAILDRSITIRVEHLMAALEIWDYCLGSARHIFGAATGDRVADQIREALRIAGTTGLNRTQIRDLLGRHASTERIDQALRQLMKMGIASRHNVGTEGRSIEFWRAT